MTKESEITLDTTVKAEVEPVKAETTIEEKKELTFLDSLPEDLKADKLFEKFNKSENALGDLAKSYKELSTKFGKRVQDLTPEELAEINPDLSAPKEASEYGLEDADKIIDTVKVSAILKDLDIPKKFAPKILEFLKKDALQDRETKDQEIQMQQKEAVTLLKKEYGIDAEYKEKLARLAISKLDPEERLLNKLDKAGLGNDPDIIRMFVKQGEKLQEDIIIGKGKEAFGQSPSEIRTKIAEYRKDNAEALNRSSHPQHKEAVEELHNLYKAK